MSISRIASRYAKSLVGLSVEQNQLDVVYADMQSFIEVNKTNNEFGVMLKSPIIPGNKKLRVIEAIFKNSICELTNAFVNIVVKKGREAFLIDIAHEFIVQFNVYKEITPVTIKSAVALDKNIVDTILSKIKVSGKVKNVQLTTKVDEDLIGGFVLQYEDKLYDASLLRSLDIMRKDMTDNKYVKKLFK